MTRLLDLHGEAFASLQGDRLAAAIRDSDGRTIMAEVVATASLLGDPGPSNPEVAAAFGADLVCLNMVAPNRISVAGLAGLDPQPSHFGDLCRLLGRPVGLNLEPELESVPEPFRATEENVRAARDKGAAFVVVTANPGRGASTEALAEAVATVRAVASGLLCFAGRMHSAGSDEAFTAKTIEALMGAGAHGALVPLPGTVPGVGEADAAEMVGAAHEAGGLAVGTIGTSQEGADRDTIRSLALAAKRAGVDIHHIGDAGSGGIALPDNIYAYGIAVRGVRHTWSRMAGGLRTSWERGAGHEGSA
jgi:hypothetical protein